jgi:hypothetical protein
MASEIKGISLHILQASLHPLKIGCFESMHVQSNHLDFHFREYSNYFIDTYIMIFNCEASVFLEGFLVTKSNPNVL